MKKLQNIDKLLTNYWISKKKHDFSSTSHFLQVTSVILLLKDVSWILVLSKTSVADRRVPKLLQSMDHNNFVRIHYIYGTMISYMSVKRFLAIMGYIPTCS